jgi:hypothetical protein
MNELTEFLKAILPTIVRLSRHLSLWIRLHGKSLGYALLAAIAIAWLVDFAVTEYRSYLSDDIVILTPARGTSGWRSGQRVADAIASKERFPGVKYTAHVEVTDGADEIRERIQRDTTGNVVAYYLNEGQPPANMRYLLPLDYDYLHIVCRAGLIPESQAHGFKHQFTDVQLLIQPNSIFAGPPGSETRQLFESIFRFYWKTSEEPEDYLHPAISDWVQARAALKTGMIDVVFFMAPFDTDTMRGIAGDQSAVLLGLDDVDEAITDDDGNALLHLQLPADAYSAARFEIESDTGGKSEFRFCPKKLSTIAARRLMVCSTAMSPGDGFTIAEAVRSALASDSKQIGEVNSLPIGLEHLPAQYELMDAHAGALNRRADTPPLQFWALKNWSPRLLSWTSAVLPFVLLFVTKLIGAVRTTAAGDKTGSTQTGNVQPTLDNLGSRLETLLAQLERQEGPLSKSEWDKIELEVLDCRTRVRSSLNARECEDSKAEVLFQAVRNVQAELDFMAPRNEQALRPRRTRAQS